jgi:hypothetical protein
MESCVSIIVTASLPNSDRVRFYREYFLSPFEHYSRNGRGEITLKYRVQRAMQRRVTMLNYRARSLKKRAVFKFHIRDRKGGE